MAEQTRTFGYICPSCGKAVLADRTRFALSAAAVGVVCDCGHSELTAEPAARTYRITVPCGVCGGEHRAEVAPESLLEGPGVALACPETKQLCCYIGERDRVERSLSELERTLEKKKDREADTFVDDVVMYEVLSELKDIAARDGISCACGSKGCSLDIHGGAVDLICPACGGRLRVPAATDNDLDRLCCQYTLTIPGKK
ncbi:MAG: hypothetical protein HFF75_04525 [Oscillospiraceae bacterium]|nr:hypothetical protein [Oscillospiraceae bacterium]